MPKRVENGREIEVNNRDILVLQRIFYAMQDVCMTEDRWQWENDRIVSITQKLSAARGGGMPNGIDTGLAAIEEAETVHRNNISKYMSELKAAEEILNGISSPNMRTFVMLMYVFMVPGEEVRKRLNMTEYGFRQTRRLIEQAQDMRSVQWTDRYITCQTGDKNFLSGPKNT